MIPPLKNREHIERCVCGSLFLCKTHEEKLGRWFTKWTLVIIGLNKGNDGENDSIM